MFLFEKLTVVIFGRIFVDPFRPTACTLKITLFQQHCWTKSSYQGIVFYYTFLTLSLGGMTSGGGPAEIFFVSALTPVANNKNSANR